MQQTIDKLAQKVADQFKERKNEDIDKWAEQLAEEVSKHSDADIEGNFQNSSVNILLKTKPL